MRPGLVPILIGCALFVAACSDDDGQSPLPTSTPTITTTSTSAPSDTPTPTQTVTVPPTATRNVLPATATPTFTAVETPTSSPTSSPTPSATSTPTPVDPQLACDALSGRSIGGAEIRSATLVAPTAIYPEYCKVSGTIPPQLNFDLRLPTVWNERALFSGGGGLNGIILPPELIFFNPSIAFDGYVTISTDSGHQSSVNDGSWALGNRLALENFAYLSTHTVLGAAKQIVQERYGRAPRRSYFIGESTGGREGLIAAQRWPDDFDGIVSLEPVYDMSALILAGNRVARQVFRAPGGYLSAAKVRTLSRAALAACDDLDGLADGVISYVAACNFDPAVLHCTGEESNECLTDAQIETVNTVRSPLELSFTLNNGIDSYPRWPIGHEEGQNGWSSWVIGASPSDPASSLGFSLSEQTIRYLVIGDPTIDPFEFDAAQYADDFVAFSTLVDATDADLSAFSSRGGKLILWHGWADYAVSAYSTVRYYQRVVDTAGGQSAADEFVRFYTSPGIDHLSGGPGAGVTDFLGALIAWVEEGTAPGDLVSYKAGSNPQLTRPLCRHPGYPRYNGKGDPLSAESFHCAMPGIGYR